MSKKDSLLQHGQKRMNKQLLPHEWLDDAMAMSDSDNGHEHDYNPRENPVDANSIEDYDDFDEVPVMDYLGRNIGYRAVPKRKRRWKSI